jgi:hypothetical protein
MAWPDMRGWSLVGGDNLVVFYYLSSSELWHDKRGGFWWAKLSPSRETTPLIKPHFHYKRGGLIRGLLNYPHQERPPLL